MHILGLKGLSSHPQENGKWPLNRGWPLCNKGSSGIGLKLT